MNKILKKIKITEPLIYLVNYSSLTYIFISLNFLNNHAVSVQISIIQALIAFLTLGFSGDIRSIFLIKNSHNNAYRVLLIRLLLSFIFILVYVIIFRGTDFIFMLALIAKRCTEWIDEVILNTIGALKNSALKLRYFSIQLIFISILPFFFVAFPKFILLYFLCWCILSFLTTKNFYMEILIDRKSNNEAISSSIEAYISNTLINRQLFSTLLINSSNLLLRILIYSSFVILEASAIISSMTIGGFFFSLFGNAYLPSYIQPNFDYKSILIKQLNPKNLFLIIILFITAYIYMFLFIPDKVLFRFNILPKYILYSFLGGFFLIISNYSRFFLIQNKKISTLNEDLVIHFLFCFTLIFIYSYNKGSYFLFATLGLGLFSCLIYFLRFLSLKISILNFYIFLTLYCLLIFLLLLSFPFLFYEKLQ